VDAAALALDCEQFSNLVIRLAIRSKIGPMKISVGQKPNPSFSG
jgi:hypothetical protein